MLDHDTFAAALRGDETRLRDEVGADAVVCVAPELESVFVVRTGEDGGQTATVGGPGIVAVVRLPRAFRVTEITSDGGRFVLTDAEGRTARGTPAQFRSWPMLLDADVNPDYEAQLEAVLLDTHRVPEYATLSEGPRTDLAMSGPEVAQIIQAGEAMIVVDGEDAIWLDFDNAWPEKVEELLPHTRALLADLQAIGRAGAEFLWHQTENATEDDEGSAEEFFATMAPTTLVVYVTGDFAVHYERMSGSVFYMDGYWPAVRFRADRTPVDHFVDA